MHFQAIIPVNHSTYIRAHMARGSSRDNPQRLFLSPGCDTLQPPAVSRECIFAISVFPILVDVRQVLRLLRGCLESQFHYSESLAKSPRLFAESSRAFVIPYLYRRIAQRILGTNFRNNFRYAHLRNKCLRILSLVSKVQVSVWSDGNASYSVRGIATEYDVRLLNQDSYMGGRKGEKEREKELYRFVTHDAHISTPMSMTR